MTAILSNSCACCRTAAGAMPNPTTEDEMTLTTIAWLCMAAYAIHVIEEFSLNWRDWARGVLGLPVAWTDFYITNAMVIAVGIAQAMLAEQLPLIPLAFAALMVINALFFHLGPVVVTRRFSPGTFTAVILFLPLGLIACRRALSDGMGAASFAAAFILAALVMAYPIVLLRIRDLPMFRQAGTKQAQ